MVLSEARILIVEPSGTSTSTSKEFEAAVVE